MNTKKINPGLLKITILSISLMINAASAIAVTIPMMKAAFGDVSEASVESLITIPSFSMMIFILLSSFITKWIGKKNTVVIGLALSFIGGITPVFTTNFAIIYFSRFILGMGTGMYNALAVSLIGDYFDGETKQKLLGYQAAFSGLGSSLATFISGVLINVSWQSSYFVYGLILPVFLLVLIVLPKDERSQTATAVEETDAPKEKTKIAINKTVVFCCLMMFMFFVLIMNSVTKIASLAVDQNYDHLAFLGTALTISTLVGTLGGFMYNNIRKIFGKSTPVVALVLRAVTAALVPFAGNIVLLAIILSVASLGSVLFLPSVYEILLTKAPKGSGNFAVSLAMVACNLGSFLSPYCIQLLFNVFGLNTPSFSFIMSAGIYLLMAALFFVTSLKKQPEVSTAE